jgi:hypothetical protein
MNRITNFVRLRTLISSLFLKIFWPFLVSQTNHLSVKWDTCSSLLPYLGVYIIYESSKGLILFLQIGLELPMVNYSGI